MLQVAPAAQLSEQLPWQRSVHIDPPSQLMLPLAPTVTSHVELFLQLTEHDAPQVPLQSL